MFSFDDDLADFGTAQIADEDFDALPRNRDVTTKNRLASLFGDEVSASTMPSSTASSISTNTTPSSSAPSVGFVTLFSTTVHLFASGGDDEFKSVGLCGLVIISKAEAATLLLYTGSKQRIAAVSLSSGAPISLAPPYIYIHDSTGKRWSAHIEDAAQMREASIWICLLTRPSAPCDLPPPGPSDGYCAVEGDSALIDITIYSIGEGALKVDREERDVKVRVMQTNVRHPWKGRLVGVTKGSTRVVDSGDGCYAIHVRKIKAKDAPKEQHKAHSVPEEIEDKEGNSAGSAIEHDAKERVTESEEKPSEEESREAPPESPSPVLARIARVGRPVLGVRLPSKDIVPNHHEESPEGTESAPGRDEEPSPEREERPAAPSLQPSQESFESPRTEAPLPTPRTTVSIPDTHRSPSYEDFHRVVGVEMDRLQARLELAMEKMIAPINKQLGDLSARQEQILASLHKIESRISGEESKVDV